MFFLNSKNGRLSAIFFTTFFWQSLSQAHDVSWTVDSAASSGLISEDYWQGQALGTSPKPVTAYIDSALRIKLDVIGQSFFVERRKLSTMTTNTNALVFAAQENKAFSNGEVGRYEANLKLTSFSFDSVGMDFQQALNAQWSFKVSPRLVQVRSFKTGTASGALTLGTDDQELQAKLDQQRSSSFGVTSNAYPLSLGMGPSVDAQLKWQQGEWQAQVTASNLWSRIPVKGAYFRKLRYDVSKSGTEFVYKDLPAVSGTYGQVDGTLELPRVVTLELAHQTAFSRWQNKVGTTWVENKPIVWLATRYTVGDHVVKATSHALQNLYLSYQVSNLLTQGLSAQVTWIAAANGKTQTALSQLRYEF